MYTVGFGVVSAAATGARADGVAAAFFFWLLLSEAYLAMEP